MRNLVVYNVAEDFEPVILFQHRAKETKILLAAFPIGDCEFARVGGPGSFGNESISPAKRIETSS